MQPQQFLLMEKINKMKKCIIIGAGTYGQVYAEYLKDFYLVTGFYDDDLSLQNREIGGIKVKGSVDEALKNEKGCAVFIPIGNNPVRLSLFERFIDAGFELPSFIHPNTMIHESVNIGKSVYILPGTHIMPLTSIGDFTMISMGVNIAHHNMIEKGCFFSQGTNVGASMHIKELAYVGIGATLMTGVKEIGSDCLVGAGAVVIKNVPNNAIMAGVPAKILRYK